MPIVKSSNLPTYDRLLNEGRHILDTSRADNQDIRPLHIGFCNLMPDAALQDTERQWFRLIGESNRVAQIYMHPFTLPVITRDEKTQNYIAEYYEDIETLKSQGLDALIITGANTDSNPAVTKTKQWQCFYDLMDWANNNATSTVFSCISSYLLMYQKHGQLAQKQANKVLGIFSHKVLQRQHPLTRGMNTKFDAPHARSFGISRKQYDEAGMTTLIEGDIAGVMAAVSADGFREICLQAHPEYDTFSLLKEFRRDINWFKEGVINQAPDIPANYFNDEAMPIVQKAIADIIAGNKTPFPEKEIELLLDNTWTDSARSIMANWIGLVYQLTHVDRQKQFMDGVDPNNPLEL